jgi:hypothetical protein
MSDAKNPFILHPEYENFIPGSSELKFNTLFPYGYEVKEASEGGWGCLLLIFLGLLAGVIASLVVIYITLIAPILFELVGEETTAQVVDCQVQPRKSGAVPHITYTYTWNNRELSGASTLVGSTNADCTPYLHQSLAIVVLPFAPTQSYPVIKTPYYELERMSMLVGSLFLGGCAFYLLYRLLYAIFLDWRYKRIFPRLQQGILLEGEILKITGHIGYKPPVHFVTVTYGFETPSKNRLTGQAQVTREDLKNNLPPIGTPVTVLYADDHAHMMV